ncbi:MAG: hypothetical protein PARBB_00624 [Parabacteroides distasonis]
MKQTFLAGLTAFALVFSSCNNILEDSGTPLAIAKIGKLCLSLEADASVSVTTKATSNVTISDEVKNNLVITGTKDGSSVSLGKSSDFANGAKAVPAGTYTEISATYDKMTGDLQFDSPMLAGKTTESVTVTPNAAAAEASITATLTNSVITIDPATFAELQKMATITELYVYTGSASSLPTDESQRYSLLSSANTLEAGKTLFVKPGLSNVFIHIEGKLIADESKTFDTSSQIRESETTSTTAAAKNYNVKYGLANTQGTLKLTINVNGTVEIVEIPVEVNPYE